MSIPPFLTLQIVTPDRAITQADVDEVEVPGSDGYFGVLPGHTPMLATLHVGQLWYRKGQQKTYVAVAFGFAEVLPDRVTILAQLAERAEDIDVPRAEAAQRRAQERLSKAAQDVDFDRAQIALTKARMRLQVAAHTAARV